jgi:cytochrome c oxidase assembly protein subunit 15
LNDKLKFWFQLTKITGAAYFILIIVGGTVRITGAGMGCPDWPLCYGQVIPPVSESQLPPNYRELYAGYHGAALPFNAWLTWIEYINRLVSVLIGFIVLVWIYSAFRIKKLSSLPLILTLVVFILTLFEAWLGRIVVETNLQSQKITVHLAVALLIFGIVIFSYRKSLKDFKGIDHSSNTRNGLSYFFVLFVTTVTQFFMGTRVRSSIDSVSHPESLIPRDLWISYATQTLNPHIVLGILTLVIALYIHLIHIKQSSSNNFLHRNSLLFIIGIFVQFLSGAILQFAGFPAIAQFVHLVISVSLMYLILNIMSELILNISYKSVSAKLAK